MSAYSQSDYEAIEAAVQESPRGRWFLGEFTRRNRAADTLMLLEAIRKLERGVAGTDLGEELTAALRSLSQTIALVQAGNAADTGELLADVKRQIDRLLADRSGSAPGTADNHPDTMGDDALFETPAPAPFAPAPAAPAPSAVVPAKGTATPESGPRGDPKDRIVFIRRASSAETSIPLADEADSGSPAGQSQPG